MKTVLSHVSKSYQSGDETLTVLQDVSVTFEAGQKVAIKGRSGIGKSTLLHLIAGLDIPSSGDIDVGFDISSLSINELIMLTGILNFPGDNAHPVSVKLRAILRDIAKDRTGKRAQISDRERAVLMSPAQVNSRREQYSLYLNTLNSIPADQINIPHVKISSLSTADRAMLRRNYIGYVFQQFHLLPEFTAVENVAMPLIISGIQEFEAQERAKEVLKLVGLEKRFSHVPSKLSGGECQRVSVARAFVTKPKILLADEPTGNLDDESAVKVRDLLFTLSSDMKSLLLVVTHSQEMAQEFEVIYQMESLGKLTKLK